MFNQIFPCNICILTVEKTRNFFKRGTLRLHKEEPDGETFENEDGNVDKIILPAEILQTNGIHFCASSVHSGLEAV